MPLSEQVRAFCELVDSGDAILFTGAGFAAGSVNRAGNALPSTDDMRRDLWTLVIGKGRVDDSSLQDLYDVARRRCPDKLEAYLERQLRVASFAGHHLTWLSMPWRRIYTLNVDDLEAAVERDGRLPRRLRTIATDEGCSPAGDDVLDVVHLNGFAPDGADRLTFSTLQYAARLGGGDRMYERLVNDLARSPFVFVGTTLDEVVLWQQLHVNRRDFGHRAPLRPSYLVTPSLARARQLLLEDLGVEWLPTTMEEVATWFGARTDGCVHPSDSSPA